MRNVQLQSIKFDLSESVKKMSPHMARNTMNILVMNILVMNILVMNIKAGLIMDLIKK